MNFYGLIYTFCAIEVVDILDFLSDDIKTILMFIITVLSVIIQIWRAFKGKKNKTNIETVIDTVYDKLKESKKSPENNNEEVNINMYEVKMSPLVELICNKYAQENGLNYPPCTQQMLNAIAEWLNANAISDIKSVTSQLEGQNKVTLNITYAKPNGSQTEDTISFTVPVVNGKDGVDGKDGLTITSIVSGDSFISGNDTVTPITITYSDGTSSDFVVKAKNGKDGVSVTEFTSLDNGAGKYTVTQVTAHLSDGTLSEFNVYAKIGENGTDGANGVDGKDGKNGNGIVSITTLGYEQGTGEYAGYTLTKLNVDTDEETIPIEVYAKNGDTGGFVSTDDFNAYKNSTDNTITSLSESIQDTETELTEFKQTVENSIDDITNNKIYKHYITFTYTYSEQNLEFTITLETFESITYTGIIQALIGLRNTINNPSTLSFKTIRIPLNGLGYTPNKCIGLYLEYTIINTSYNWAIVFEDLTTNNVLTITNPKVSLFNDIVSK